MFLHRPGPRQGYDLGMPESRPMPRSALGHTALFLLGQWFAYPEVLPLPHIQPRWEETIMRVYTNRAMADLWSYVKLAATLAILFVIVSQAAKLWRSDANLQELRNLTEQVETP